MGTPESGLFALVSYVPSPLGPFLDEIRRCLPGTDFPKAHITVLPPRPLNVSLAEASEKATEVLEAFSAFEVELESVARFVETEVIYATISRGRGRLIALHRALNDGCLCALERFEFLPHITLGGPVSPEETAQAQAQAERAWSASEFPKSFLLREIVALWSAPNASNNAEWEQVWCFRLPMVASAMSTNQKL